jgi:hypothetical protein
MEVTAPEKMRASARPSPSFFFTSRTIFGPLKDALRAAGAFEADHGALSPSARHLADDAARLLELRAAIRESRWEADPTCPWRTAPKADILRAVLAGRDGLAGCFAALERAPPRALAIGGDE